MGLCTIAKSFTKTWKVDFLEENNIWEVPFWRVMTNVCVLARFAVLLVITKPCFASPCNANDMCLFLPHWCPITLWTFRQKAHTHVGTNLFTMFDANKHWAGFCLGQKCTMYNDCLVGQTEIAFCVKESMNYSFVLFVLFSTLTLFTKSFSGSTTTNPVSKSTI